MAARGVAPGSQHPEEYREDLNPRSLEGENAGEPSRGPVRTLEDIKEAHEVLKDLHKDELRQLIVAPVGERLDQGATYIDLRSGHPAREFTATAHMTAMSTNWYVRKDTVHYELWNRLIGVRNEART